MHRKFLSLALLSLLTIQANAQINTSAPGSTSVTVACQNDVSKFEQLVGVVRQLHGEKAANNLREKLLPSKDADEALSQFGQCGLARLLRTKKLV